MTTSAHRTTLYLRGVPTRIVREAKAAAARRGSTLTAFVSDTLERSLETSGPLSVPADDGLADDMRWYEAHRGQLLKKFPGQYVVIVGRAVMDHDNAFDALASRVFARLGVRNVFMPRVTAAPRAARIRSPRAHRR